MIRCNSYHRRTIAATLVNAAYIVELDRQQNRHGAAALAPQWWNFFGFELIHVLADNNDLSFFGCIFQFIGTAYNNNYYSNYLLSSHQIPPTYVIAFRGTVTKPESRARDLRLDLQCIGNSIRNSSRFQQGLIAVADVIKKAGSAGNVWLAGHSLGSAIGLLIGKDMAKFGCHLETYLFNPPFISLPIERIKNEKLKHGLHKGKVYLTAALAAVTKRYKEYEEEEEEDPFVAMSGWVPYLFVNPADPICSGYIGYFENREKMMEIGDGKFGSLPAKKCFTSIIISAVRGNDSDAFHLLPNAYLTSNHNSPSSLDVLQAHGINQWWKSDLQLEHKLYKYR